MSWHALSARLVLAISLRRSNITPGRSLLVQAQSSGFKNTASRLYLDRRPRLAAGPSGAFATPPAERDGLRSEASSAESELASTLGLGFPTKRVAPSAPKRHGVDASHFVRGCPSTAYAGCSFRYSIIRRKFIRDP